ncbi:MAG TPA: methyltransferase domain-containing protein [Chitinophagaceae bacterium]|nr:methyltransferase domain-containing protein [Chitinophagaceae bacterium]
MSDVLGCAIWDYHFNLGNKAKLWIHNKYGPKEEMPVETYFRGAGELPELEITALDNCRGRILDVGAGAGSHALFLQQKGLDVTALDVSPKACEVTKMRGVKNVLTKDIYTFTGERFDTILLLMNGIGLTGTILNLRLFLRHIKQLLFPGGQLIFDSSDVAYLYDDTPPANNYYGEIDYEYRYKGERSGWFKWLYIDKALLAAIAKEEGWQVTILFEDDFDQYLARLL